MTFTWNITLGQLLTIAGIVVGFLQLNYKLNKILFQHELMWWDYCTRKGIDPRNGARLSKEEGPE